MKWFRMYVEVVEDPKVQTLSGELFKAWVNLLCFASRYDGVLPPAKDIAWVLRVSERKVEGWLTALSAGEDPLLERDEQGRYIPHNWNVRQYKSDSSTGRVRAFRERSGNVSPAVTETPQHQDGNSIGNSHRNGSDSVSVSVSGNDAIFSELTKRHPKKTALAFAETEFATILSESAEPDPVAAQINTAHGRWCRYWATAGIKPQFVPKLMDWLKGGDWRFDPPQSEADEPVVPRRMM